MSSNSFLAALIVLPADLRYFGDLPKSFIASGDCSYQSCFVRLVEKADQPVSLTSHILIDTNLITEQHELVVLNMLICTKKSKQYYKKKVKTEYYKTVYVYV